MSGGNPEAMRTEAAALRSQADALVTLSRRVQAHVDGMEFEGPAATRFRDALGEEARQVDHAASDLSDLADYVLRAAARVEAELEELHRQEESARSRGDSPQDFS
jgi:hypothetical protein